MNRTLRAVIIIGFITFAASLTPIVIRITQTNGVPSIAIIFMRLTLGTLIMTPFVWRRYHTQIRALTRADWLWAFVSGFWLALNLLALFYALEYTSVLVTGILRRTTPVWIIVPEIVFLGAFFTWRTYSSTALSVIGVVLVTLGSTSGAGGGSNPLLGVVIALLGAIFLGMYLLIGRKLSSRVPSLVYSWMVFASAASVLWVVVLITQTPLTGYTPTAYGWVIVVTFLSQYAGHVSINLGLQMFSATTMSIIMELSVVLGGVLAFFQFGEVPTPLQLLGGGAVVIGVVVASMEKRKEPQPESQQHHVPAKA